MTKMITIHNISTGEIIEREMTQDELAKDNEKNNQNEIERLDQEQKDQLKILTRQAVLDKLGLSADEVAALLG